MLFHTLRNVLAVGILFSPVASASASPDLDVSNIDNYFLNRFPTLSLNDFVNGAYALNNDLAAQFKSISEFSPIEIYIEQGKTLYETPFPNGKYYKDCLRNGGIGIAQFYPYFDGKDGKVKSLSYEINQCRIRNSAPEYAFSDQELLAILAYLTATSAGKKVTVTIPDDPRALQAYEEGKRYYYSRRGKLNLSCSHCHVQYAGRKFRGNVLSPALGQATHWPVYHTSAGILGSLHGRYQGCIQAMGEEPPKDLQSDLYNNLEYFHATMSNGIVMPGPVTRN